MKTLPHTEPVQQAYVEDGRRNALEEVQRLEAMSDAELVAERLDLIEQTGTTQALCALIVDIQKRRNIDRTSGETQQKLNRVISVLKDHPDQNSLLVKKLWLAIKGIG